MSHPKIPERPHHPPRSVPPESASESTAAAVTSSSRKHPLDATNKGSGIINFGAFFREHLENSLDSDSVSGFRKYLTKSESSASSHDKDVDLSKKASELGIKFFLVAYSTLNSDCRTCLVSASAISNVQKHGCHLATAMFFKTTGADPDIFLVPDPKTLIQLPWKPDYAWIQGNMFCNGAPSPQCPRRALINQVERARKLGLVMMSGIEPEFTLLNEDGSDLGDLLDSKQPMCLHDPLSIMRNSKLLSKIHDTMEVLGWKPYQVDHEATKCQYEINFNYADALTMADRHCFMKFMMKELAELEGQRITFMPVPFSDLLCANGLHINVSLWTGEDKINLFIDDSDKELGISKIARHFIGGLMEHVGESCAVLCPTVNSYKRLNSGSWCPNTVTWGGNNRTVLIRVPINSRVEHRIADGSTNPYLAQAVVLAAGLDGICRETEPGEMIDFEVHKRIDEFKKVPRSLLEALNLMETSLFMKECLGEELVEGFVFMKRKEWDMFSNHLSQWEKDYYVNC